MKFITLVFLCTLAAAVKGGTSEEALEYLKVLTKDCAKETGATEADIGTMMKHAPANNMETKCLRACVMKKVNVISPDGKFDKEKSLKLAEGQTQGDPEKIKIANAIADGCKDISVPDDHCEAAELYDLCLLSEAKKFGITELV